ncbi:hypothetical protein Sme01_49590 [Sphaerisporangium melleum]|uniref:ATP-binding protein n=1 Tax=Sphaerisporangium melleum TaxID=321316 RepID=A0A917R402_9ACTN|nr:hypothetical protein GCM10007964_34990 [Sphaerisporangium melleum]GII72483.1 hypothetical protein Sme01_49590 [Sphaerisporangium melleum]
MLTPRLSTFLDAREPGHCARIIDIGAALAERLCRRLRTAVRNDAQVHVLGGPPEVSADVAISSTKLIELRNPDGGRQRPPLLVFVPPGTRASAEDSFDVATFEEIVLGDVYSALVGRLLAELPEALRRGATDLFDVLNEERWAYGDSAARARYLLAVQLNDFDPHAAGAAVFELGMVPDFDLFAEPARIRTRAARNLQQMRVLSRAEVPERQRVVELHLADPAFRARLAAFVVQTGLESPRTWTRRIVVDRANWKLAFQHWPLREERPAETLRITVGDLDLPRAGDRPEHAGNPTLANIAGQMFLPTGKQGPSQLPVTFEVTPDPRRIAGLTKFTVQLLSEEAGPTGVAVTVRVGKTAKTTFKTAIKKLRGADLEQGWHYIRVLPQDDEGIPLPVELAREGGGDLNESDRFLVVTDDDIDEPPPQQRVNKEIGLTHALRRLQFAALAEGRDWREVACRSAGWKAAHGSSSHVVHAAFGGHAQIEIPLAPMLAELERRILTEADQVGRLRMPVHADQAGAATREEPAWPGDGGEAAEAFIEARRAVFAAIRGTDAMVVEGRDLIEIRHLVQHYAETYGELLSRQLRRAERAGDDHAAGLLRDLTEMLQVDCVTVDHTDARGTVSELTLVAPTHPLRLLWLVTWAELGHQWLADATGNESAVIAAAGRTLAGMTPLGFPLVVPRPGGRLAVAGADLNPYWGVCLPTDIEDPQGVLGALAAALRLPERWTSDRAISGKRLADRVERYLRLHPYVSTLVIAVVNAGRAEQVADMLVELQRRKGFKEMTYDVRLFARDPEDPGNGDALARLLRGEWSSATDAEPFHTRTAAGITPKLSVAVRPLAEFRSASGEHSAHITLLLDAFSGERFDAAPAERHGPAHVHGLQQGMVVSYVEDEDLIAWHKQPHHGPALPITGAEELTDLLTSLPPILSAAASAVTTGQVGTRLAPRITLSLDVDDGTLLHQAHRSSDWVITADRTLGVEYFDSPDSERRPDYIIDFDTDGSDGLGHHVVISSRSADELRSLLSPVIAQHGFAIDPRHTATFFDQLRLLSGRLAFKLASAVPTQRTEVLGLALARLYLDYQGALADQILVPLDAHLELYREARKRADEVGEAVGLQRTDLALFSLNARRRTITCRLVEVKCYSSLGGLSAHEELKNRMTVQLDQSAKVLADHFDPHRRSPDRPDRVVRNAEFAALLRFYLGRAVRYRTMKADAATEAEWLLTQLDRGYRLEFTRTGLIFDLAGKGASSECEGGIEFHRVGRDLAEELIEAIPTDAVLAADGTAASPTSESLERLDLTLPRLSGAAFRAPARAHEVPATEAFGDTPDDGSEEQGPEEKEASSLPPAEIGDLPETYSDAEKPPFTAEPVRPASAGSSPPPDVYLGSAGPSPQYGVLGEVAGRKVALDLNETHTISLFGVQGGGKSYTLGTIIEAASLAMPASGELSHPLATIVFHYSPTLDYAPEFTSMVLPNDDAGQIEALRDRYGADPAALTDVVMLVPEDHLEQRRVEYPAIDVVPLKFGSAELRAEHWRFLMGAIGNQSTYIRQLQRIMKANRKDLRLEVIRDGVERSSLSDNLKQLALERLNLAAEYIDDTARVKDLVRPGRMIIVDLRDEYIEKDEALGLFVVLMQLFAEARSDGERFNKLVVFDEAHKYIESPDLVAGLVESVREMRHKGMSVLVASQDPPSVPISLIELSNHVILHKFTSPAWLKHLQKANASLAELTSARMAALTPGEAYVWSSKATDAAFTRGAVKVRLRPRATRHGGGTKTALG